MPQLPIDVLQSQTMLGAPEGAGLNPAGAAAAFADSAATLSAHLDQQRREQLAVAKQQAHDEALVAVTNARCALQAQSLQDATDAANNGTMAGFTERWSKQFDQQVSDGVDAIPAPGQAHYRMQMAELKSALQARFAAAENGARNIGLAQDSEQGINADAQIASIDPSQAADLIARRRAAVQALTIPDEEKQKLLAASGQRTAYAAGATLVQNDPQAWLDKVGVGAKTPQDAAAAADAFRNDPTFSQLAPANLEALTNHARVLVAQQQAAQLRDQDAAEKAANDAFNELTTFVNSGQTPSLDYIAQVTKTTRGTTMEQPTQQVLQRATAMAGFGSQTLPRQQATLEALQTQFNANGTDPQNAAMLASLQAMHDKQTAAYKDDALDAFNRFAHGAPMPTQPIVSVEQGLQLIQQRAPQLANVDAAAGATVSPLHPAEAEQFGALLRQLPPDQAASALTTMGAALGTQPRIAAVANQLHDKDSTLALAMGFAGLQTNTGRLTAELVLRGDAAIRDGTAKAQSFDEKDARAQASAEIGDAYLNQQVKDAMVDASVKIAAARAALGQGYDIQKSVNVATGGMIKHGAAGGIVPLPYGVSQDDFEQRISSITAATLAPQAPGGQVFAGRTPIPLATFASTLKDATLQHAGQGRYVVKTGTTFVTNAAGAPIVLTVKP